MNNERKNLYLDRNNLGYYGRINEVGDIYDCNTCMVFDF